MQIEASVAPQRKSLLVLLDRVQRLEHHRSHAHWLPAWSSGAWSFPGTHELSIPAIVADEVRGVEEILGVWASDPIYCININEI